MCFFNIFGNVSFESKITSAAIKFKIKTSDELSVYLRKYQTSEKISLRENEVNNVEILDLGKAQDKIIKLSFFTSGNIQLCY